MSELVEAPSPEAPALGGDRWLKVRVETFAGDGIEGHVDGDGRQARFNQPWGLAVDANGVVYVADSGNHRIRMIFPSGHVQTLAGSGRLGFADGTTGAAEFNWPRGVAVDGKGNVYVADTSNDRIRKITPQNTVSTHSGDGTRGFYDGARAVARFSLPNGITVDAAGVIYVADATNYRVRKVSPGGTASTLAGSGGNGFADAMGAEARFNTPRAVAVDAAGNVYVTEVGNCRIRKVSPSGDVTTLAGDGRGRHGDGPGAQASFREPCGVCLDREGNLIVADTDNQCIRLVRPDGVVETIAGDGKAIADYADGDGPQARFNTPTGVCVGPDGAIYVADTKNHCIRRITLG